MLQEKYVISILSIILAIIITGIVLLSLEIAKVASSDKFYNHLKFGDKIRPVKHLPKLAQEAFLRHKLTSLELGQLYHAGTSDIPKDVNKAIKYYHEAAATEPYADLYLARIYSEGDEKADVLPDAGKAIKHFSECVTKGMSNCLLDIGDIFAHGLFGDDTFKPDPIFAKRSYLKLMLGTKNNKLKHEAKQRITELDKETGRTDATNDVMEQTKLAESNGVDTTFNIFPTIVEDPNLMFEDAFKIRNDMNNVHDTFVNKSLLKVTNELKNKYGNLSTPVALKEIEMYISKLPNNKTKERAEQVYNTMKKSNTNIASQKITETDGLKLVWNKINSMPTDKRDDLRETFVKQLADGVEYNHVVCPQGRLSRVLDTFAGVDNTHIAAKSKDIIRQEMLAKSGKIREIMLSKHNGAERRVLENPQNADEMKRSDAFDAAYKKNLIDALTNDYLGITGREFIVDEINSWQI
jgi:hypothetical protein